MTVRVKEDRWGPGPSILDPQCLETLRAALALTPLIVEHWYYRGGSSPTRLVFEEFEELREHLERAKPGDAVDIWRWDKLCRSENIFASGKRPDSDGAVPAGGPY